MNSFKYDLYNIITYYKVKEILNIIIERLKQGEYMLFVNDIQENRTSYKYRGSVFQVQKEEKYVDANFSTSERVTENGQVTYKNSCWPTRFVGNALVKAKELSDKDMIAITQFKLENIFVKEKGKSYLRLVVFEMVSSSELKAFDDAKKSVANTDPNA